MKRSITHFLFFFFLSPILLQAKIIYINLNASTSTQDGKSWSTAYKSLKPGLESAKTGDEVWITKDTYPVRYLSAVDTTEKITLLYSIKIYGGFQGTESAASQRKADKTVISGQSFDPNVKPLSKNLIYVSPSIQVSFDQVIFANANSSKTDNDKGGALLVDSFSVVNLYRCYFRSNAAQYRVACINSKKKSVLSLDSCQFFGNGPSYAYVFCYDNAKFILKNCLIHDNTDDSFSYFFINGSTVNDIQYTKDTLVYVDNVKMTQNGNMNFVQRDKGNAIFKNCYFDMGSGNAIYCGGDTNAVTWVEKSTFYGNPRNYLIYCYNTQLKIKNCLFDAQNKENETYFVYGSTGGVSVFGSTFQNFKKYMAYVYSPTRPVTFDSCQFLNNACQSFSCASPTLTLHNSVWQNNASSTNYENLIYFGGKKLKLSKLQFKQNVVDNNYDFFSYYGVDSVLVDSSLFDANTTGYSPLFRVQDGQILRVRQSQFTNNTNSYNWMPNGQIYSSYKGTLQSIGNLYKGNHCTGEGCAGVGYLQGKSYFLNDVFDGNLGDSAGAITNTQSLDIANCDFLGNSNLPILNQFSSYGSQATAHVYNSILFGGNTPYVNINGQLQFSHCFSNVSLTGTANVLDANTPVDANYFPVNVKLIDAGALPPDSLHLPIKDFAGGSRIVNILDIGAVEHPISTGLFSSSQESKVFISPNPVVSSIASVTSTSNILSMELVDAQGTRTLVSLNDKHQWNIGSLENGLYICDVLTETGRYTQKLIVNR